ncbi:MAG: zinc-binding dehydrogenase [Lachnospiraceae bacterium]|nr:zinc-binding dehydrogenase [Lachnospiraceae bacterium]
MKTRAVRLHGKSDLRVDEFELPEMKDDEILARVVSDSICMSTYKAAIQGEDHKRVPADVSEHPTIMGHEFCGEIIRIGSKWADRYKLGQKFSVQTALNYKGSLAAPGYSYRYIGGDSTYVVIPNEVMELDCLLEYDGDAFFCGSLAEPYSCVAGTFHAMYHTAAGSYSHEMGIREGGVMGIIAGVGPMGLAAIDYIIHCDRRPGTLVVTDIAQDRLDRASALLSAEEAERMGVRLTYLNTAGVDARAAMLEASGGKMYDDVLVFAPVPALVELADSLLGRDGCLNFFSGPSDPTFSAKFNFYNVHYAGTHIVGTSGGNKDDMRESLRMMSEGRLNPAVLVTHIGGLNCVPETTLNLPHIPGGKKLIYTHIDLPLTAIADFEKLGGTDPLFARLDEICKAHGGLWCVEAERILLEEKAGGQSA